MKRLPPRIIWVLEVNLAKQTLVTIGFLWLALVATLLWFVPRGYSADAKPAQVTSNVRLGEAEKLEDGFTVAERSAYRVRVFHCKNGERVVAGAGSAFAIGPNTLISNNHVVTGSPYLEYTDYLANDFPAAGTATSKSADLSTSKTRQQLPVWVNLATSDPEIGDELTVIGYPNSGPMTTTTGKAIRYINEKQGNAEGKVLLTDVPVMRGNSGSAAFNNDGEVVGIVYATNTRSVHSYIIPVSELSKHLADSNRFVPQDVSC